MRHLLFNLHGGLSAFGESAVQHARPASEMPTRSGVLGLVANCLGIERADAISINAISKSLGVGIAIYDPGSVMMDFHTTQTAAHPPQGFVSRAQQLKHGKLGTEISEREWRIGLIAVVALWSRDDVVNLDVIADALRTPKSIPFLGRKAAPTCAPMNPRTVDADTLGEAFAADAGGGKKSSPSRSRITCRCATRGGGQPQSLLVQGTYANRQTSCAQCRRDTGRYLRGHGDHCRCGISTGRQAST